MTTASPTPPAIPGQPVSGTAHLATLTPDQHSLFDALAFVQMPVNANHLVELLTCANRRTARGSAFHGGPLRALLADLMALRLVQTDGRGQWWVPPEFAWPHFVRMAKQPESRRLWWDAWRAHQHFDNSWRLSFLNENAVVAALRVVIYFGGTRVHFDRLVQLSNSAAPDHPVMLACALLQPFDPALFSALDPELRLPLLAGLLNLARGDQALITTPLWAWLRSQCDPDPQAVHEFARLALAEHLLFCGDAAEALRLVQDIDHSQADAVRAAALIVQGDYAQGVAAFDAALKQRAAAIGKRKQLMPQALAWIYAFAQLASTQPADWVATRKYVAAEAGKRDADPHSFWGIWQAAVDQRLGDAPRSAAIFRLALPGGWQQRLPGLQQLAQLLLAAWLGHEASAPKRLAELAGQLDADYRATGQRWLALLTRRAAALLLRTEPSAQDAAQPFPIGATQDRWREALNAIVALGAVGGGAGAASSSAAAQRLLWTVRADAKGRIRAVAVLEQKAGARGLGKPKPLALSTLMKRADLPAHDAAVLRAVKKQAFGGRFVIDRGQAVLALVRHPHVAWHDAPEQAIEINEALPRLEVLTQGQHLQFRVLDPIRPEDALTGNEQDAVEDEIDFDDETELRWVRHRRGVVQDEAPRHDLLLLRQDDGHARLLRITPAQLRVAELVSQGWQVPSAARTEMDAALRVLGTHFQLASDADTGHEVPASAVLRAELTPQNEGLSLRLVAAPFGDFGPRLPPGQGRQRVTTVHQGVTLSTQRDLAAEKLAMQTLVVAADCLADGEHQWSLDEPDQALAVVETLATMGAAIVSEWPKGRGLRVRPVVASQVALRVVQRQNWLGLEGELKLDGGEVVKLEKLLELLPLGQRRYIALGDGEFLALSDTLRQQLADLRALAQPHGKGAEQGQRLAPMAALAWAAQPGAPALQGGAAWEKQCQAWEAAQTANPALPAGLQAELRDYQQSGWRWLMRLAMAGFGAVLADDMGLGKTLQTLGVLAARAADGPALVVAPTSVCGNWLAEAARFTPGLRFALYGDGAMTPSADDGADDIGSTESASDTDTDPVDDSDSPARAQRRRQVQALGAGDVLVCSYGLLQQDSDILSAPHWHSVVLDEAQAIKNAATRRAKAAFKLNADFRLALSGTPVENRLGELWSIMAFANPGLLGSAELFNQRFAGPIERDGDADARRRLRRLVAPFVLRRTKAEVLADLPPRTEIVHSVVPGPRERALLEALRRQAEQQVGQAMEEGAPPGQAQMHILAALTRLRRAACDPRLVAPELAMVGAKVQAFEQLAQELVAGRHKALVFSQFTDFLALLRDRLDAAGLSYQYLDGSTPAAQRTQRVNRFQAGEGDFFLISLKAGGFGLNLTMADYVIIADPWWNPAAEDQASGRAHRIGQQRPVTVYRLVTQGSIEERIVKLHQNKRDLADGVLAGQDGSGSSLLGAADMLALLRGDEPDAAPTPAQG